MIFYKKKKLLINFNKRYFLRLEKSKRFQHSFYYIVVTNSRDGIINTIGYYNPKKIFFKQSYIRSNNIYKFDFMTINAFYTAICCKHTAHSDEK